MSWIKHHEVSEQFASEAQAALREGRREVAQDLYARAADAEGKALEDLDPSKSRTLGISAVSAVSLYYKAASFKCAEKVAARWLASDSLPAFAEEQLRVLLQSIWSEQAREKPVGWFAPNEVLFSVQGGEVVRGGAPLDLVMGKMKTAQSFFYRTTEFLYDYDYRRRGPPSNAVKESCRPRLFQTVAGSYQFAIAIQEKYQPDSFQPKDVAGRFLQILRIGSEDPEESFRGVVPDPDYRGTFLKLMRDLAPGRREMYDRLEVRSADEPRRIMLDSDIRRSLEEAIRKLRTTEEAPEGHYEVLEGVLRAIHLDKAWLELAVGNTHLRVVDVGVQMDRVIGPMVNKPVRVHVSADAGGYKFLRIEPDDSSLS